MMLSDKQALFVEAQARGDTAVMEKILNSVQLGTVEEPVKHEGKELPPVTLGAIEETPVHTGKELPAPTAEEELAVQDAKEAEMYARSLDETPDEPLGPVTADVPEPEGFQVPDVQAIISAPVPETKSRFFRDTQKAENNKKLPKEKSGWDQDTGLWTPYKSLEGGTDTVAYGHKITGPEKKAGYLLINGEKVNYKEGLTEAQAEALLEQDINAKVKTASAFVKRKHRKEWGELTENQKAALLDVEFNAGLTVFPSYTEAVVFGEWEDAARELRDRHYKKNGKKIYLHARNEFVIKNYLKG